MPPNERFTLISFVGFPAILQLFQICIFSRRHSKLTFSNGPQLIGRRVMANVHASLDSTCKSRIWKISTGCWILGGPFHNFWSLTEKWEILINIFYGVSVILRALQPFQIYIFSRRNGKLKFSNSPQVMGERLWQICMHHWTVHAKVEFEKFPPDVKSGGSIPQFFILNWEMKDLNWSILFSLLQY